MIFITGGTGFVGRHIVNALTSRGYRVRVLARREPEGMNSSLQAVLGDLTRPDSFAPALEGVSTVIHAALTDGLSDDLEATSKLHRLSAEAGVRQFVHLSTISVYGNPQDGVITEETPPIPTPDPYASTKLAIEEALRTVRGGCPEIAILRLGCVYGPGAGWWTQGLLNMMAHGKLILVNGGTGFANLIHAEDAASIVPLLLARSNPAFEIYNVTDGVPVTWKRYYSEIEKVNRKQATISMSAAEAREYSEKWLRPSLARRAIRKVAGGTLIHPLDAKAIEGFASQAIYSNEKASRVLGFHPAFDFERGMESLQMGERRN